MEKVNEVIEIINRMDIKDKLRVGICMSESSYTNLKYNKSHIHSVFDKRLKREITHNQSYRTYKKIDFTFLHISFF